MDRRKRSWRTGLLGPLWAALQVIALFSLGAQIVLAQELPLELRVESDPPSPLVNQPWTFAILVNHPNPDEVSIQVPELPSSLVQERVRTETRLIPSSGAGNQRWTRVEYLFNPQRAELLTIPSFTITVQEREAHSPAVQIQFREPPSTLRRYDPRFRWQGPVPSIAQGEEALLILELADWDPLRELPSALFQGRSPRNAILSEARPQEAGEALYHYPIRVWALEGTVIQISPFSIQVQGFNLAIPGLNIPVLPPLEVQGSSEGEAEIIETGQEDLPPLVDILPFPDFRGQTLFFLQNELQRSLNGAKSLWEDGRRAEALAEIRRSERDRLSGPYLVELRREMEEILGLGYTENESWRPLGIPLFMWGIIIFLFLSALVLLLFFGPGQRTAKDRTGTKEWASYRRIVLWILAIVVTLIFLEEGLGNFSIHRRSAGNTAILERTLGYRVPDVKGAVNARFSEGQPVIIGDSRGDWCYAETPDGRSGWVARQAVITY
ncbi:MAG: SH3 domain-containing protein [Treponema sp.]|nr:SH3 domain-containing protein [Treponema sp.]